MDEKELEALQKSIKESIEMEFSTEIVETMDALIEKAMAVDCMRVMESIKDLGAKELNTLYELILEVLKLQDVNNRMGMKIIHETSTMEVQTRIAKQQQKL